MDTVLVEGKYPFPVFSLEMDEQYLSRENMYELDYSHFKQICNIRLYLQTLSRKGIERLPIPKECRILKQNNYPT